MRKDGWEPCPRCGSNKVQQRGKAFFFLLPYITVYVRWMYGAVRIFVLPVLDFSRIVSPCQSFCVLTS
ncbi:hypothetical protein LH47_02053 [Anoxybacillus thermarum]|uniref:Transposase n=1 Tax=Anoxybacillus thermarum TaxID=404937 RepID=A0A0D0Q7J8_9BACL|nr:hypothetical protein LH47_02053 [Anoxybacillus thermarum]